MTSSDGLDAARDFVLQSAHNHLVGHAAATAIPLRIRLSKRAQYRYEFIGCLNRVHVRAQRPTMRK